MKEIYQQTVEEVLDYVESIESGLTSEQVKRSREKCGWNELAEGKKKSILQIFFEQYKDFLVLILIASAVISGMLGDVESAAVIVIVITINAILGTVQTVKAEQSLQSLKKLSGPEAKVLRNGVAVQLPARELVVGDVILLEAGDMIPADGRLIENASLKVDESALTGESLAVEKSMDTILAEAPLGDRTNMLAIVLVISLSVTGIYDFVVIIKGNGPGRRVTVNMNSELTQWLEENLEKNDLLLTPEYSMNEVTMSGAMLYCGWPYYAWSAGYDTNYRAAQAVTIYTTSDSETLKKTVQQEKITYILFEEGSEFEQQECREETIAAAYEKVYETQDGRIRIYKTTE